MNTPQTLHEQSARDYIATCELAECDPLTTDRQPPPLASGAVVASSLLAFTEGTPAQGRQDVIDSFLFATLAANKAFSAESDVERWYGKFNEVLAHLGWLSSQWRHARYQAGGQRFSMDALAFEMLGSAAIAAALPGPAAAALLKVAADAIKGLKGKEQPLRLFEHQSRSHQGARFRVAACTQVQGLINVVMGAVSFQARTEVTDVLFWEWGRTEVETWCGEHSLVLNSDLYARHRDLVQERLHTRSRQAIAEFDI